MFMGLILAILIIVGYAMYVNSRYALKSEMKKLENRISELEGREEGRNSFGANVKNKDVENQKR